MDSGISGREGRISVAPMGREPFQRVGALQTLARQTAPTAFAPLYPLTGSAFEGLTGAVVVAETRAAKSVSQRDRSTAVGGHEWKCASSV